MTLTTALAVWIIGLFLPPAVLAQGMPEGIANRGAGDWVRVELHSGERIEGNFLGSGEGAVRLQGDKEEIIVPLSRIRTLSVPRQATWIGGITGAVLGGLILGAAGAVAANDGGSSGGPFAGALIGAGLGCGLGATVSGSFTGWKDVYEQETPSSGDEPVQRQPSTERPVHPVYREVSVLGGFATNVAEGAPAGTVGGRLAYYVRYGLFAIGPDVALYQVRIEGKDYLSTTVYARDISLWQVSMTARGEVPAGDFRPYALLGLGYRTSDYSGGALGLAGIGFHYDVRPFRLGAETRYNFALVDISESELGGVLAVFVGGGITF